MPWFLCSLVPMIFSSALPSLPWSLSSQKTKCFLKYVYQNILFSDRHLHHLHHLFFRPHQLLASYLTEKIEAVKNSLSFPRSSLQIYLFCSLSAFMMEEVSLTFPKATRTTCALEPTFSHFLKELDQASTPASHAILNSPLYCLLTVSIWTCSNLSLPKQQQQQ